VAGIQSGFAASTRSLRYPWYGSSLAGRGVRGPIEAPVTEPIYADIELAAKASLTVPLPESHNAFVYIFEGSADIAGDTVETHAAALLDDGLGLRRGPR